MQNVSSLTEQPVVVLTFDTLPTAQTLFMDGKIRTQKYIDALAKADVQMVFFTIGNEIEQSKMKYINQIIQQGHLIANHSYSHPHLSAISVEQYLDDVNECEKRILPFSTYRQWFRYPFLDVGLDLMEGRSIEKAVECALALKSLGFRHAYVSIDSLDWFIDMLFLQAIKEGKEIDMEGLEHFYLEHIRLTIKKYLSKKTDEEKNLFSTQIFLFHANDLNALFLPKIITMLREDGWRIGTPDEMVDNPDNQLVDFKTFIDLKVWLDSKNISRFHDRDKITQDFNKRVLRLGN